MLKKNIASMILLLTLPLAFSISLFASTIEYATLQKISDGDTFTFRSSQSGEFKCRLLGIDTPEKFGGKKMEKDSRLVGVTPETMKKAGEAATQYAQNLLNIGQSYRITTEAKSDPYGRKLCVLALGETTYNEKIVKEGYAVVYKNGKYIQDESFKRRLLTAQKEAKSKNRGLWSGSSRKIMKSLEEN